MMNLGRSGAAGSTTDTSQCELIYSALQSNANQDAFAPLKRKGINLNQVCIFPDGEYRHEEAAIFYAIRSPSDHISNLIRNGANPNIKNDDGITPLMFAAQRNYAEHSITLLLKAGANPKLKDANGLTFFGYFAAEDSEIRQKFITTKVKPTGEDDFAYLIKLRTANISNATNSSALQLIKNSLAQNKKQPISFDGLTPIEWAIQHSDKELLEILVSAGLPCKLKSKEFEHSQLLLDGLKLAAENAEAAKCLIADFPSLNVPNHRTGWPPLMDALNNGLTVETINILLTKGAGVNFRDEYRRTPLMIAVAPSIGRANRVETVRLMMAAGADIHAIDANGHSVVMHAASAWGDDDITAIQILEEAGAKLDVYAPDNCSAVELAWLNINFKVSKYLESKGVHLWPNNALMCAVGSKSLDHQFERALSQVKDGNAIDGQGRTALILAAQKCQYGWVKDLVKAGARKYEKDKSGNTALQYLKQCNEYIDQRVLHGGKINIDELRGLLSY